MPEQQTPKQQLLTKAKSSPAVVTGRRATTSAKKSPMLKIRGFITGKSRKERQKEREAATSKAVTKAAIKGAATAKGGAKATVAPTSSSSSTTKSGGGGLLTMLDSKNGMMDADDQSTVYGVDVDEASAAAAPTPAGEAAKANLLAGGDHTDADEEDEEVDLFEAEKAADRKFLLKVVLLLMDSKTRRFELLQLEFDTASATVADVLAQIPVAVTEDCLQEQVYKGITGAAAIIKPPTTVLSEFCEGSDVMVAIADGMTSVECVKLARPILSDPKVMAMLKRTGIDASAWKKVKKSALASTTTETKDGAVEPAPKKSATKAPAKEAKPVDIKKAVTAAAVTSAKDTKATVASSKAAASSKTSVSTKAPFVEATKKSTVTKATVAAASTASGIVFHPTSVQQKAAKTGKTAGPSSSSSSTSRGGTAHSTPAPAKKETKKSSIAPILILLGVMAVLAAVAKVTDLYLAAPIQAGQVLPPGMVLHKCGLAGAVPGMQSVLSAMSSSWECENASLVVEKDKVTGYDQDGKASWLIVGGASAKKVCRADDKECSQGLHFKGNKQLTLSGTKITWVEIYQKGVSLSPWPFEEKPAARLWRK